MKYRISWIQLIGEKHETVSESADTLKIAMQIAISKWPKCFTNVLIAGENELWDYDGSIFRRIS